MQLRAREKALQAALTEKVAIEKSLESSRILFQTFVEHNPNICYFKAEDGKYLSYNAKFAELFGIGLNDWIGKSDYDTQQAEAADQFRAQDELVLNRGIVSEVSHQIRAADGRLVWLKLIKFAIRLNEQRSILAGVAIDVTPEVKKEQALSEANVQLMQMAQTDPLTGVSNRRFFEERIASEFARTQNAGQPLTLIILDIDDFKKRNDTYGHAAGDDALRMLGGLLRESLRGGDLPARIGGEEFAILLAGMNEAGATLVARRIQDRLRTADCGPVPMTVSMGIASASPELESWEKLYSLADRAMYQAKASGKNRFVMA
jgi:diguanylate cyclase (GGDEF)-like protein/PAS domain S-box-containing protein